MLISGLGTTLMKGGMMGEDTDEEEEQEGVEEAKSYDEIWNESVG